MAFVTKTWKDRLVEYAGRRKLKNVATGEEVLMDVSRSEGTVSQAGDAFSAANMNNLEQRIKNEFDTVNSSLNILCSYSTEEINTGETWIDGKPIFRKVIAYDSTKTGTNVGFPHNISNLGNFRCYDLAHSTCIRKSTNDYIGLGCATVDATNDYVVAPSFFKDTEIYIQFGKLTQGASGYIALLYTHK